MKKSIVIIIMVGILGILLYVLKPNKVELNASQVGNKEIFESREITGIEQQAIEKEDFEKDDENKVERHEEPILASSSEKERKTLEGFMDNIYEKGELSNKVDGVIESFNSSSKAAESTGRESEINNFIHQEGIYDTLLKKNIKYISSDCRASACKLRFQINEDDDNMSKRMTKMQEIAINLSPLETLKGKRQVINNDIENSEMEYYFY